MWRAGPGSADVSSAVLEWPQATPLKPPTRINAFASADEDVSAPGATVPSFHLSAFCFPYYEEGEYSSARGAAEHAEKIQSSSLRALRASA